MPETSLARPLLLGGAALAAWNGAFAAARPLGIWLPIAAAALLLDALGLGLEPGLRRPAAASGRALALGAGAGFAQIAATLLLFPVLARALPSLVPRVAGLYGLLGTAGSAALLAPTAFVAASEELVFRGALQPALGRALPGGAGVPAAALLYALCHLASGEPLLVAVAFLCGLYWGALRAISGGLWAGLVAHLAWDAVVLFASPLVG